MNKLTALLIAILMTTMLIAVGCQGRATELSPTASTAVESKDNMQLRIGVMPAVDSAPILLAEKKGYFKELGLEMDIQVYNNPVSRQGALQSGELDGTITDLIALVNNMQNGLDIKITTCTDGSFPFLLKKGYVEQKKVKIAVMEASVVDFLSDQFLSDKYELEKIYIAEIPARLEMIKAGQIDIVNLPEPMAAMGELVGLKKVVYSNTEDFMPGVMVFTGKALKEKEKAVQLFHQAYNKAIEDIKQNDAEAREVLIEKLVLRPEIKNMMTLPVYHSARIPDEAYIDKVIAWIEAVQEIDITITYHQMIERKYAQ